MENARRYFTRYSKARAAATEVPRLLAGAEHELAYLDEALTHLDLAGTPDELAACAPSGRRAATSAPAGAEERRARPGRAGGGAPPAARGRDAGRAPGGPTGASPSTASRCSSGAAGGATTRC